MITDKSPIWRNFSYSIANGPFYVLDTSGNTIYSGYAKDVTGSGSDSIVNLQQVFKNYVCPSEGISADGMLVFDSSQYSTFTIYDSRTTAADPAYSVLKWWDWSYDLNYFIYEYKYNRILSNPVNTHWNELQTIPVTFFRLNSSGAQWRYVFYLENGPGIIEIDKYAENQPVYTLTIEPYSHQGLQYFYIDDAGDNKLIEWSADDRRCGYGSLIYVNQYGGWDSFLLEHNITEKYDITKDKYSTGAEFNTMSFDETYIIRGIQTSWSTNTGWLTDEQSNIMYNNMFNSPVVYFQLFGSDRGLIPVNFTNTEITKKEFKNGKHLISYDLEFKESQTKTR